MKRLVEFSLAGKSYPLNFSVKAARWADEELGGLEKLGEIMEGGVGKGLSAVCALLYQMMEQGAAYCKLTQGVETEIPAREELEILIGMQDMGEVQEAVMAAAGLGAKPTVEVEPDPKNGGAARAL